MKTKLLPKIGLYLFLLFKFIPTSMAQGPFTCSTNYFVSGSSTSANTSATQLYQGTSGSGVTLTPIGGIAHGFSYNAIGYNTVDNYIYAISGNNLVKIANDGSVTNLGAITGGGFATHANWVVATFLPSGEFIVRNNGSATSPLFKIDINTLTATVLSSSLTERIADMTYSATTGLLYTVYSTTATVVSIDPITGVIATVGTTSIGGAAQGMFTDINGKVYATNSGSIYEINLTTGAATTSSSSFTYTLPGTVDATSCNNTFTLPIKLISFSSNTINCNTVLNWKTATESNVNHFEIQRSSNGSDFLTIDRVEAKNSSTGANYLYQDNKANEYINYYRLLTLDIDGRKEYSKILRQNGCKNNNVTIYPNPTQDILNISGIEKGNVIQVINDLGQVLITLIATQNNEILTVKHLPKNIYVVTIQNNKTGQKTTSKFSKQ